MNKLIRLLVTFFAISTSCIAQQPSDPRIADITRAGELRVGIGLGVLMQAIKNPATGELRGAALELARALAARMGVKLGPVDIHVSHTNAATKAMKEAKRWASFS